MPSNANFPTGRRVAFRPVGFIVSRAGNPARLVPEVGSLTGFGGEGSGPNP